MTILMLLFAIVYCQHIWTTAKDVWCTGAMHCAAWARQDSE